MWINNWTFKIPKYASSSIFVSKTGLYNFQVSKTSLARLHLQVQWNEKEKIILDELWIVLEEKLELRKQLLTARQAVSDKLTHIDEFERLQGISS